MPGDSLILRGRVAAVLPENTDTDLIFPGRYLNITDREQTAAHLFELAWPEIRATLRRGDFLVAGKNFGCGSSREQATAAILHAGVGAVIAPSFARIFYRNSINLGLPLVVCAAAPDLLRKGDELSVELEAGMIRVVDSGMSLRSAPLDVRAVELLRAGGLIPYLKRKYAA
jgi:3-isopropylmalate dehydratase small subunit